jgi:hypothetical protein
MKPRHTLVNFFKQNKISLIKFSVFSFFFYQMVQYKQIPANVPSQRKWPILFSAGGGSGAELLPEPDPTKGPGFVSAPWLCTWTISCSLSRWKSQAWRLSDLGPSSVSASASPRREAATHRFPKKVALLKAWLLLNTRWISLFGNIVIFLIKIQFPGSKLLAIKPDLILDLPNVKKVP